MHERTAMAHRRSSGEVRPYVRSSKPRFNWTSELKQLFEEAVIVLRGTRKATPKQIRELMKCPYIQLSHIKSRLQMCRIRVEDKGRKSAGSIVDNIEANGDEHSVVVDENEANDTIPPLSTRPSSSLEYQSQHYTIHPSPQSDQSPFKRLRVKVQPTASSFQSNQYHFNSASVPRFSSAPLIFRKEQSMEQEQENKNIERLEEEDFLQLCLSLSGPTRANKINLDLSLSFPQS